MRSVRKWNMPTDISPSYIPTPPRPPMIHWPSQPKSTIYTGDGPDTSTNAYAPPVKGGPVVSTADPNPIAASGIYVTDTNADSMTFGVAGDVMQAYRTILAWGIMAVIIYIIGKTRAGYAALYYSEWLILLFLFATQAQFFREKLSPITQATQPTTS